MFKKAIGRMLKDIREKNNVTVLEMSRRVNVSPQAIYNAESGKSVCTDYIDYALANNMLKFDDMFKEA